MRAHRHERLLALALGMLLLGCDEQDDGGADAGRILHSHASARMDSSTGIDAAMPGSGGTGGAAFISTNWQPLDCGPGPIGVFAGDRALGSGCTGCFLIRCCEALNACAAAEGREGCAGAGTLISQCLDRQGIAAEAATTAQKEACLAEWENKAARFAQVPELVPAMVALFDCFRTAPSATCTTNTFDDAGHPDVLAQCTLDTDDDAGTPPQTCLEQCREERPQHYSCVPDAPDPPEICRP